MHCTPITTAPRKKQRVCLTNGGRRARPCVASEPRGSTAAASFRAIARGRVFGCICLNRAKKTASHAGFHNFLICASCRLMRVAAVLWVGILRLRGLPVAPVEPMKKNFGKPPTTDARPRIRVRTTRIDASDSQRSERPEAMRCVPRAVVVDDLRGAFACRASPNAVRFRASP